MAGCLRSDAYLPRTDMLARFLRHHHAIACCLAGLACTTVLGAEPVEIKVLATVRRGIDGVSRLDRNTYFSLSDAGRGFDKRVREPRRMEYLLEDLDVTFGRSLGPIRGVTRRDQIVREDQQRPGYADLRNLEERLAGSPQQPGERFSKLVGGRLDVAAHGAEGAYPEFMGVFETPQSSREGGHKKTLPENLEAAAELAAAVLEHDYTDFDRPRYFEPVNEPHWSFTDKQHLADWHVATQRAVRQRGLEVLVGGPCNSVAYHYRRNFNAFKGIAEFMRKTDCQLDFYSFHVYDYLHWKDDTLKGRITSGLPLEGVLDFVQAHTVKEHGEQVDWVVSEQGGYINNSRGGPSREEIGDLLAQRHGWEEDGFDLVMKKRSVSSHVLVSAAIANTLAFMDHPHTIKKAVPFILLESMAWDPEYYSTLYTPHGFTDRRQWVESSNSDFYKFFRGLKGDRVVVRGGDPDLQVRAFADKRRLRVVFNNLSDTAHATDLSLPAPESLEVRRYGRADDFTPYLREESVESLKGLTIAPREAVMVIATYDRVIPVRASVNELPCYAGKTAVQPEGRKAERFTVLVPDAENLAYAELRIAVTRPFGASPAIRAKFNGKPIELPMEDSADRYSEEGQEYASIKLADIDRSLVREKNRIDVAFPDDRGGAIGSVVLRVAKKRAIKQASRP